MKALTLLLYSRQGCCLCQGLAEKLEGLPLERLDPPFELQVIDIDHLDTSPSVRDLYDQEVPVMAIVLCNTGQPSHVQLPRVSPRLKGEGLFRWLQRVCTDALVSS